MSPGKAVVNSTTLGQPSDTRRSRRWCRLATDDRATGQTKAVSILIEEALFALFEKATGPRAVIVTDVQVVAILEGTGVTGL